MVFAGTGFFALAILGLGMMSFVTDTDIIDTPGGGQAPAIVGMAAALLAFVLSLASSLRVSQPSFFSVPVIALIAALAHLVALWATVLISAGDIVLATATAGSLVIGGASLVLLLAAAVAAWFGIALRRTRARRPRWPWEPPGRS